MNELPLLPDMTLEEAQVKHAELKALESVMRSLLLEMRDRKGWLALGFSSWAEYGEKEWNYSLSQLDRLATAARIESFLPPIGGLQIPESHLRPLSKVDDADKSAVWQEAVERARDEGKKLGAKMVEEVVNEYIAKNQALQQQLGNYQTMYSESSRQRDELRDNQQQIIDAKVSEERAKLLLENSDAIQQAERKASDLQDQLDRLKKEHEKNVRDGVNFELGKRETEIRQLDYQVESLQKQAAELRNARDLLETENGVIKQHQESIKDINSAIQSIKSALYLADESGNIPVELIQAWDALNLAMAELANQLSLFCNRGVGSVVINGNLLSADTNDDFGVDTFNNWGNA